MIRNISRFLCALALLGAVSSANGSQIVLTHVSPWSDWVFAPGFVLVRAPHDVQQGHTTICGVIRSWKVASAATVDLRVAMAVSAPFPAGSALLFKLERAADPARLEVSAAHCWVVVPEASVTLVQSYLDEVANGHASSDATKTERAYWAAMARWQSSQDSTISDFVDRDLCLGLFRADASTMPVDYWVTTWSNEPNPQRRTCIFEDAWTLTRLFPSDTNQRAFARILTTSEVGGTLLMLGSYPEVRLPHDNVMVEAIRSLAADRPGNKPEVIRAAKACLGRLGESAAGP